MTKTADEDHIRQILDQVTDPETGRSLAQSGMVDSLIVQNKTVQLILRVDPARGSILEEIRQKAEQAIRSQSDMETVNVILTAERAPARPAPQQAGSRGHEPIPTLRKKPAPTTLKPPEVRHVIAIASGKGGVGKSTLAANLAVALAQKGLKIGLMDADIYGPSIARMFGGQATAEGVADQGTGGIEIDLHGREDGLLTPPDRHGVKVMSMGHLVPEERPMIWRGPMVQGAVTQLLRDVAWGALDILLVDLPPGTGDAQLTLAQRVPLSGAVIISTPQDIALIDARKGLAMFQKIDVPILGLVENMSYHLCSNCGHREEIFGHGGAEKEAQRLDVPFLGVIPLHSAIREEGDAGAPIVAARPESPQAQIFLQLAEKVAAALAPAP